MALADSAAVRVRAGDLVFTPGPERRQRLAEFFETGWAHIAVTAEINGRMCIVEFGPKGCVTRSLKAVIRHYGRVEIGRLPVPDAVAQRVADAAIEQIGSVAQYADKLACLAQAWGNLRSVDHYAVRPIAKTVFPVVACAAWMLGRGRQTCSSVVYEILSTAGVQWATPMRFDESLPDAQPSSRPHIGWRSRLCSPGDFYCSETIEVFPLISDRTQQQA